MTKPTAEQRLLERMDQLVTQMERVANNLEQQNALLARGSMHVIGTTAGPRYYGNDSTAEAQREHQARKQIVRRPRQASRGKG